MHRLKAGSMPKISKKNWEHNYIFYRIEEGIIYVTDIYNEREDFMWDMFGIRLRTDESIDYWGE